MTQEQYKWLQDNGYDPTVHDVDDQGNIFENPINQPQQKEVMSVPRAFGTSFLGNLLPSAAALAGGAAGMEGGAALGAFGGPAAPVTVPLFSILGGIGGGLGAGYLGGKGQQAALEKFAPSAIEEMQRAETDQPVASWAGGAAPALLTFKPSFKGISGLSAPLMRGRDTFTKFDPATIARFTPAALNVGVNAANAGAGQLVNMSEGGEFSLPRFAADTAFGSIVSNPNAIGRKMGFPSLTPQRGPVERMDLAGENARRADIATMAEDVAASDRATELLGKEPSRSGPMFGPDARKFDIYENQKAVTEAFDKLGIEKNPETIQDFVNDPMLSNFRDDPAAVLDYVSEKTGLKSRSEAEINASEARRAAEAFESEYAGKSTEFAAKPTEQPIDPRRASVAENRKAIEEVLTKMKAAPPEEFMQDLANDPVIGNLRDDPQAFQDFIGQKAEKYLEKSWQRSMDDINRISKNLEEGFGKEEVAEFDRAQARREEAKNLGIKDIRPARDAAEEIHQRFQRPVEEGPARITQEDLDAASEIAAMRGLKITFADLGGGRGKFQLKTADGVPLIEIDPNAATRDTAIHEIGHDVYARSVGEGMRKGLVATAEDSPVYKAEYEARINARDEQGNPTHTEAQARDIALEEGLIQAFGEAYPNVKSGAIRQWFNAIKASMKDLVGMKLSPEDASAYLYYLTNENVPWKGVAVAKGGDVGEERLQRGQNADIDGISDPVRHWTPIELTPSEKKFFGSLGKADMSEAFGFSPDERMFNSKDYIQNVDGVTYVRPSSVEALNSYVKDIVSFDRTEKLPPSFYNTEFIERLNSAKNPYDDIRYQRAQQETPEFKNWFGESKVVDADGKPLTVYHGTRSPEDFNTFRTDSGHNYGPGAYFTPEARRASGYAGENEGARVYSTYVKVEKPYIVQSDATVQDLGYKLRQDPANDALMQSLVQRYGDKNNVGNADVGNAWLRSQGYDGIIKERNRYTEDGFVPEIVEVVAFNPEQVKSATGNRGTFDPLNKDIRYQRPIVGKAKDMAQETLNRISKFAELDNLESRGGIHAVVAKGMRAFYATRSFMEGKPKAFEKAINALSPERRLMLGEHIGQELDQRRFIKPSNEIAEAYNEYRQQWQKFWPAENNQAGHTVRTAGGQRARLTDPYYGPFHMWSDNVRDIMTTKQGSPEYVKLQDDYIKYHVQAHQQNGVPLQEAQTRAAAEFSEEVRALSVPYDPTAAGTFAGARKAQGIPLPHSWREYDILKLINNYDRRSAIDFAMQEHMERSPEIMAALGSKTFFNDQPIPAQIKAAIPDISTDKSVQSILREMSGQPAFKPDSVGAGASRSIGALTIGTVSKATEIPTTMIAGLRYLQMSDYLPGTMKFIEKLADWSALQERSYASGLNKRDASQNMRQVSGVAENAAGFLNKFAEGVSSVTGLNKLEQAARTLAQGWGEVLVQINKNKAATGDKDAVRMLDTLSPDWRTRSDADLAAQFGKLMQGSYDMTQLPAWMLESGAAPYLTWSKWSAGQYSNFVKFAIEPAMQGNVKPLIGHLLIGVMGGAAVDQIREWMNNREGRDVNWNELESWMQQNQGQLGAEGMKQLSVKLLNIMQGVGTFGIAGDLAKMVTTAAVGGTAQGMATAPVANAVFDTSKKVAAALKAIDDGEDFGLVLRQAMGDIAQTHIQVARVGRNWLDEQENLRYDDRRQRRLFDELTGAPTQAGTFSVNYGNLAERAFERGDITEKTGEEAFNLVSRARQEATSGEDYASRIRKLKTSQNAIMPSLERQPMKAARYLSFVEGAEPGKGSETLKRYYTRQNEDKYRKSLIEGMSGIR